MSNFEDRDRKPGKRGSFGSPSSGERSERQPGSQREGGQPGGAEERPGAARKSPHTEEEEE
jgi:hypothetical protein